MNSMWKRSFALLLSLVMVFGMVPVNAFAEETEAEHSHSYVDGICSGCGAEEPAAEPDPIVCNGQLDCPAAEGHAEDCLKAIADAEAAKAAEEAAKAAAEASAQKVAEVQAMIDALPAEVKRTELAAYETAVNEITAILATMSKEETDQLTGLEKLYPTEVIEDAVAMLAGTQTYFANLNDAFTEEHNPNKTQVVLVADCTQNVDVISGHNYSFYLNGHTMTGTFKLSNGTIQFNGSLNGSEKGTIQNTGLNGEYPIHGIIGNFNIGAVNIIATGENGTAVFSEGNKVNFETSGVNVVGNVETASQGIMTISTGKFTGGIVKETGSSLNITGGSFSVDPSAYLPDGYFVVFSDGYYVVKKDAVSLSSFEQDESGAYLIQNAADVQRFRKLLNVAECGKVILSDTVFKQTASIDMAGITLSAAGSDAKRFGGIYDGQNYTISNVTIDGGTDTDVAFFGNVYQTTIKNVHLHNVTVTGGDRTAALVGYARKITIQNCKITGNISISGRAGVGGIIGQSLNPTTITGCEVSGSGTISGSVYVGGVIGNANETKQVTNNKVEGITIQGDGLVGGLVGYATAGSANLEVANNSLINTNVVSTASKCSQNGLAVGSTKAAAGKAIYSTNTVNNSTLTVNGTVNETIYCLENFDGTSYADNIETDPAFIGGSSYKTLDLAVNAANAGDKIVLHADATATVFSKNITIDLNGNTLTGSFEATLEMNGGTYIDASGKNVITSSSNPNKGDFWYVSDKGIFKVAANGIEISGVDVTLGQSTGTAAGHTLTLKNGVTAVIPEDMVLLIRHKGIVEEGATLITNGKILLGKGAEMKAPEGLNVEAYTGNDEDNASDYEVVYIDGTYKLSPKDPVAKIGKMGYETLEDAIAAGGEILLLKNVTVSNSINVEKPVTLDLNGKTITNNVVKARVFEATADMTINGNGGKVVGGSTSYGLVRMNNSSLVVNGGTYDFDTDNGAVFKINAGTGDMTLNNVTVDTNAMIVDQDKAEYRNVTITGGSFTTDKTAVVIGASGTVTLTGATITSNDGAALEVGGGTTTITDCTITSQGAEGDFSGGIGIYTVASSGSGNMTIAGKGNKINSVIGVANSGATLNIEGGEFAGQVMVWAASGKTSTVNISGGTFTNATPIVKYGDAGKEIVSITGGTFKTDVSAWVAIGYEQTSTGKVEVAKAEDSTPTVDTSKAETNSQVGEEIISNLGSNTANKNLDTNIDKAVDQAAINAATQALLDEAAKTAENDNGNTTTTLTNVSTTVSIKVKQVEANEKDNTTAVIITYDVSPMVTGTLTVTTKDGNSTGVRTTVLEQPLPKENLKEDIFFHLPVPSGIKGISEGTTVHVKHIHGDTTYFYVKQVKKDTNNNLFIEMSADKFSNFIVEFVDDNAPKNFQVGSQSFEKFEQAYAYAKTSGDATIKVLQNTDCAQLIADITTAITLDLNGKIVENISLVPKDGGALTIKDSGTGGTLHGGVSVFKDGTFNLESGNLKSRTANSAKTIVLISGGTANIKGGTVTHSGEESIGIQIDSGILSVTGGTISGTDGIVVDGGNVNLSGGTVSGTNGVAVNGGYVTVFGGSFSGTKTAMIVYNNETELPVVAIQNGTFRSDAGIPVNVNAGISGIAVGGTYIGKELDPDVPHEDYEYVQKQDNTYMIQEKSYIMVDGEKEHYAAGTESMEFNSPASVSSDKHNTIITLIDGGKVTLGTNGAKTFAPKYLDNKGWAHATATFPDANGKLHIIHYFLDKGATLTVAANGTITTSGKVIVGDNGKGNPAYNYTITQNNIHGNVHVRNSSPDMVISCNGFLGACKRVYITGGKYGAAIMDVYNNGSAQNGFSVVDGSTKVTLTKGYLNGLTDGTYTMVFQYKDGEQKEASFKVTTLYTAQADTSNPKTGDVVFAPMFVLFFSTAALAVLLMGKKKFF